MRVAILTNIIPSYRRGFYKRLLERENLDITIFCQSHLPGFNLKPIQRELDCKLIEVPFWSLKQEKAAWQWLPVRRLWQDFDVYVFYGNPRVISNVVWATFFNFLGKSVIIWGQGHTYGANPLTERLRLLWWRLFDYILVYTDREADHLKQNGFNSQIVIGANNGLDQEQIDQVVAKWSTERLTTWQAEHNLTDKTILLSSGRLESEKRFDLVIAGLPQLVKRFPDLLWCVVGDGSLMESLQSQAQMLRVSSNICWLGAIYDEYQLAPWFLSSRVLVHPGAIGLTLLHAFGYGLPVITHNNSVNHGPEFAALVANRNGLLFDEGNVTSLYQKIVNILEDDALQRSLGQNARQVAKTQYNTQVMVEQFLEIVNLCFYGQLQN